MVDNTEDTLRLHERLISENKHEIASARQVLEIRLDQLGSSITELKNAMKWAGGLIISLMLSFMAWAALQQFNSNEEQKRDLQEQIKLLQNQEEAANDRERILRELRKNEGASIVRDDASIIRDDKSDDQEPNRR